MLKIRLKKIGRKKLNAYQVVLKKSLSKRDGSFVAYAGFYNPQNKNFLINKPLVKKAFIAGARPTNQIRSLIKNLYFNFQTY